MYCRQHSGRSSGGSKTKHHPTLSLWPVPAAGPGVQQRSRPRDAGPAAAMRRTQPYLTLTPKPRMAMPFQPAMGHGLASRHAGARMCTQTLPPVMTAAMGLQLETPQWRMTAGLHRHPGPTRVGSQPGRAGVPRMGELPPMIHASMERVLLMMTLDRSQP